jgi:predicted permease
MDIALALLPDFLLILLGSATRRWLHLGDHAWAGLEKLIYFVLFPALLFNSLASARFVWSAALPLLAAGVLVAAGGMCLALLVRPALGMTGVSFASQFQCAFRFNTYVGLAVAGKLFGSDGLAAMSLLTGAMVPPVNLAAVGALARMGGSSVWRELARNPLVLATIAGLLWNGAGLPLPQSLGHLFGRLADAAIALGLLAVGAALRLRGRPGGGYAGAAVILAIKLLALPLLALACCRWLALDDLYGRVLLAFAALPTASSAYILAQRMGGDGASVAWQISVGTLVAMATLPLWLALAI